MATRCCLRRRKRSWWRSTRKPEKRSGPPPSMTTRRATTCRWRRSSPTARCCLAHREASWGCAGSSLRSTLRRASRSGKPTQSRRRASLAARPGRRAATNHYKRGGATIWITGNYDPETNLSFWGTGNGGPWFGDQRPGGNLYTSSVVAFDVGRGASTGHFQYHPNDSWDGDEVSPPIVLDYHHDGRAVKGLVNVSRSGYLWQLERTAGPIKFVAGQPYVRQNVFKSLDPKTGRPDIDET